MFENISYKKMFIIMLGVVAFSFFFNLSIQEADIMEARNFITAREMVSDGNWLIPKMNGNVRIEKPPLPTWITAAAYKLGDGEKNTGILRIPAAIFTSLMIFLFFGLIITLTKNKSLSFISSIVLATSFLIIKMGKTGSWDIYTNVFTVGALYFLLKSREKIIYSCIAGIFIGLAIMSKGPVSIFAMFIPFIISYIITYKVNITKISLMKTVVFILTTLFIGGMWYFYIYGVHSEIALKVATVESTSWLDKHTKPFWYYWYFVVFSGVWVVFGIASLIKNKMENIVEDKKNYKFTLIWMLISLLLLSLLPEKKERYLLPVVIPMAFLIGQFIAGIYDNYKNSSKFVSVTLKLHLFIMSFISLGIPMFIVVKKYKNEGNVSIVLVFTVLIYLLILGLLIKNFKKLEIKRIFILTTFLMLFSNIVFTKVYIENVMMRQNKIYKNLSEIKNSEILKNLSVYSFENIEIQNVWRIGGKIEKITFEKINGLNYPIAVLCSENELRDVKMKLSNKLKIIEEYTFFENEKSLKKVILLKVNKKI